MGRMTAGGSDERRRHWEQVYEGNDARLVSWFQERPVTSLELVDALGVPTDAAVVDVGGGASTLVDELAGRGFADLTVLDVSQAALDVVRRRIPDAAVTWLCTDLLAWEPPRRYDLWHDRAVFHFLTDAADRRRYVEVLQAAMRPGAAVIVATFAADGPERCSGLPVARYSPGPLVDALGDGFETVETRREEHTTPAGAVQPFTWVAGRVGARP